jgi:hypothetical protein
MAKDQNLEEVLIARNNDTGQVHLTFEKGPRYSN